MAANVQSLRSIIDITGGVSDRFRSSIGEGDRELGQLGRTIRGLRGEQTRLQRAIDAGDGNERQQAEYRRELRRVSREVRRQEGNFNRLNRRMNRQRRILRGIGIAAGVATAGAAALGAGLFGVQRLLSGVNEEYRELNRLATISGRTDISTLQRFDFAFQRAGFQPGEGADIAAEFGSEFNLRLAEALTGINKSIREDLAAVGVDIAAEFEGITDPAERLLRVISLTQRVSRELGSDQARVVGEALGGGTEGKILAGIGADAERARRFLEDFNNAPALSAEQVQNLDDLSRAMIGARAQSQHLRNAVAADLAPALIPLIEDAAELTDAFLGWVEDNPEVVRFLGQTLVLAVQGLTLALGFLGRQAARFAERTYRAQRAATDFGISIRDTYERIKVNTITFVRDALDTLEPLFRAYNVLAAGGRFVGLELGDFDIEGTRRDLTRRIDEGLAVRAQIEEIRSRRAGETRQEVNVDADIYVTGTADARETAKEVASRLGSRVAESVVRP